MEVSRNRSGSALPKTNFDVAKHRDFCAEKFMDKLLFHIFKIQWLPVFDKMFLKQQLNATDFTSLVQMCSEAGVLQLGCTVKLICFGRMFSMAISKIL